MATIFARQPLLRKLFGAGQESIAALVNQYFPAEASASAKVLDRIPSGTPFLQWEERVMTRRTLMHRDQELVEFEVDPATGVVLSTTGSKSEASAAASQVVTDGSRRAVNTREPEEEDE